MSTEAYRKHLKEEVIRQEGIPWDEESEKLELSANSLRVLAKRYLRKDLEGKIIETPAQMFRRVAYHIALPDKEWGGDVEATTRTFYEMLTKFRFMPNSPTFTGAGTPLGQLAACFVLPISDDMGKEPDGIFMTLRNAALIQQTGGGNGFSFSRLRPKGDRVSTSAGVATGPVGFMKVYDMAFDVISQGGVRRGANMAVLRVDHPDVLEFVRSKEKEGELTNFNISVALTDEFMRAVEEDREFDLVNPRDGKVWKTVRARDLFDEIVRHAHHNGEPGALFIDTANRTNPLPHLYELEATNPCVTGDTLVATPAGWRRADEIRPGDEILTVRGVGKVATVEVNPDMPVYRVRFSDGGEIRATASHQFHVVDPESGEFTLRRLDSLQVGDKVRVSRPMPLRVPVPTLAGERATEGMREIVLPAGEYVTEVTSISFDGVETVYDLFEPETDTWLTAGYVSRGCGEQWLGPYENCCLGSINLAKHVKEVDGKRVVDWDLLRETVENAVHFLDNVVTANEYVPAVPQLKEAAHRARRIGLGIMGLADMMYDLGIRYGSEEAREFAAQVMEFVRYHAMRKSIELAKERGPFPAIKGSIYDPEDLKWRPPEWPDWLGGGPKTDWGRPPLDWDAIVEGIKKHGIRNAAQTTVAPTGCLVAGTLVATDQGLLPIEKIGNQRGPQWQEIDLFIASEGGTQRASHFYVNGVAHTIRVVTKHGYVIQGTDGHRVRVWEDGHLVWRRLDEIEPGMRVALMSTGLVGEPREVRLRTEKVTDFHDTPVTLPETLTPELAYIVGFFMGDGSLKEHTLRFNIGTPDLVEHLTRLLRDVFDIQPKIVTDPRSSYLVSLEVHSRNIAHFWRRNGFAKMLPHEAHKDKGYIPHVPLPILLSNDKEIYGAFLAGLFDADGYVHNTYHVVWATTCQPFHDQVKSILLALGILTTSDVQITGMGQTRSYRLRTAHARAARCLADLLRLSVRISIEPSLVRRPTLGDTVPISVPEHEQILAMANSGREERQVWGWKQRNYRISRSSLKQFVDAHRLEMLDAGLDSLVDAIDNDVFYDEIIRVEDGGYQETFDLSVPETHAYIANGFISHNTIATVSGCEGYGCEPAFALAYIRHFRDEDRDVELEYVSPRFMRALDEAHLDEAAKRRIIDEVLRKGTCQHIDDLPESVRHTFVVAQDITAEEHVYMQAALQVFVDNSISKCVVGDTLVLTAGGLTPIRDLADFRLPDQFHPLDVTVLSPEGEARADAFYYGGQRETRRVRLQYGFQIEGTPNHRVHVLAEDGRVVFKRLDALNPGDVVVLYSGQRRFGPPARPLPRFSGTFRTNSKKVTFPSAMSEDLAFFLGCLTSAGAITVNGVNIANQDRSLLERLNEIVERLFGLSGHIGKDPRNGVPYLQVNSRALRHWLVTDLGLRPGAANKIIPTCILQAGENEVKAFLKGLFLDAYVTEDGKLFGITLASEKLIRQLQTLLLNLGVLATVRQATARAWNLTVQGGELARLAEFVDFVETWKNARIARREEGREQQYRNYSRLLPRQVTDALRAMKETSTASIRSAYAETGDWARYQRVRINLTAGHRLEREDARTVYEHLRGSEAASPFADAFFAHDRGGKIYVAVEDVTTEFAEVFDIHVPGSHTFIANGLGNHNTINFPEHATVDDVKTAYFLAWRLGCKGITVYVTGTRKEVVLETRETKQKKEGGIMAPATIKAETAVAPPPWNGGRQLRPRPTVLQGKTYRRPTPVGTAWITVNSDESGEPFEVFLNVGKAGSDVAADSEALGRLISLILRLPSPLSPRERLREVIHQLSGIGGGRSMGFGPERVRSLPDAIAQVLRHHLEGSDEEPQPQQLTLSLPLDEHPEWPATPEVGDICPECGQATFIPHEGCKRCTNCGYSEC